MEALPPPPLDEDPLEAGWRHLDAHWDAPDAHRRFVGLAASLGRLPEVGARYREVRDTDPDRRETAEAHIDRLLSVALQGLEVTRTVGRPRTPRWLFAVAGLVVTALVAATLIALAP